MGHRPFERRLLSPAAGRPPVGSWLRAAWEPSPSGTCLAGTGNGRPASSPHALRPRLVHDRPIDFKQAWDVAVAVSRAHQPMTARRVRLLPATRSSQTGTGSRFPQAEAECSRTVQEALGTGSAPEAGRAELDGQGPRPLPASLRGQITRRVSRRRPHDARKIPACTPTAAMPGRGAPTEERSLANDGAGVAARCHGIHRAHFGGCSDCQMRPGGEGRWRAGIWAGPQAKPACRHRAMPPGRGARSTRDSPRQRAIAYLRTPRWCQRVVQRHRKREPQFLRGLRGTMKGTCRR